MGVTRGTTRLRAATASIALVSFAVAFGGCGFNATTGTPELSVTSKARERELGASQSKAIEAHMGLVDDADLNAYVREVGRRLSAALPTTDTDYTFHIVDSETPNAFALPGGYVYVTRGLLAYLNSEDELACVMGHEIAHVAARHSVRQRTRSILASPFAIATGIAGAATGIILPPLGGLISGVGEVTTGAVLAGYSREQEREADRIGMELAARAGWAPGGMAEMLTTLERNEKLVVGKVRETGYLDSHPSTPERGASAAEHAAELTTAQVARIAPDRLSFYRKLDGILVGVNPADGVFIGRRFVQPTARVRMDFPADWDLLSARNAVAAADPERRAAIVMYEAGIGDDPLIAADARKRQLGFDLSSVDKLQINGLPASRVVVPILSSEGPAIMHVTWVVTGDRIYEISAVARPEDFDAMLPTFAATVDSFDRASADDRAAVSADRMRTVIAEPSELLNRLLDRVQSSWSPAVAAVANGLGESEVLAGGRPVKAPVSIVYAAP